MNKEVKTDTFSITRKFFHYFLSWWREQKLVREIRASEKELAVGKGKVLKSLRDLR
ncbi:MAG TPA: hypothetical protein VJK25_00480 [Patescibacteria group bacterium]|nr:hypothetical protein [Patescibacteria group bacterium]